MYLHFCIHSSIRQWASRLPPGRGYCEQRCRKPWGTCVLFKLWFSQGVGPVMGLLGRMTAFVTGVAEISVQFSIVALTVYVPTGSARRFDVTCFLNVCIFGCTRSQPCLYQVSAVAAPDLSTPGLSCRVWDLVSWPGVEAGIGPLHWDHQESLMWSVFFMWLKSIWTVYSHFCVLLLIWGGKVYLPWMFTVPWTFVPMLPPHVRLRGAHSVPNLHILKKFTNF